MTDQTGIYRIFDPLPMGTYDFIAEHADYPGQSGRTEVVISGNFATIQDTIVIALGNMSSKVIVDPDLDPSMVDRGTVVIGGELPRANN